jgi:putative nucleotidyltransferase with HDIG domain
VPLTGEALRNRVEEMSNLPTLPGVVQLIARMIEEDDVSAKDLSEVIARDQVLTSKILRMVNSPVYGFPERIASITHALVLLGFNTIKTVVLTTAVFDELGKERPGFWQHSLGTALVAKHIAKSIDLADPEEIMMAGLLHDLGKVVLAYLTPDDYEAALMIADLGSKTIREAEVEIFGVDHTLVGGWVSEGWHLPARLRDAIIHHHHPSRAPQHQRVAAVVHVADILSRTLAYGDPGDKVMPPLDHPAYEMLGLDSAAIDQVIVSTEVEYRACVHIFQATFA